MQRFLWVLAVLAGCNDSGARASEQQHPDPPRQLAGVYPEQWRCDSIATLEVLGTLLGGTARQVDSAMPAPPGTPHPCSYEILTPEPEYWTFDVDCRDGMKQRADALFAQYRAISDEAVQRHARVDAGAGAPRAGDAGVASRPEPAVEVAVGAKGLDHRGQGLIFIDDDAPCYVRVTGKDAARRFELARLIARNLTASNAPMTPRALR